MSGGAMVSLREVSKWYGAVIGVNQVSLELAPGITGLLGPNGAGKTTLMKLVTGQLRPSVGEVSVLGRSPWAQPAARRSLGFSPEVDAFHEEMTGRAFVRAMGRLSGMTRAEARTRTEAALETVGMAERADKRLKGCSKGMRQRIKIAQALVHDPPILVLDEPLSGIDPPGRVEIMALLRRLRDLGKTVLVSTHILHEVESITERIVLMAKGRVLATGIVSQIRELLAEHPLTVRIDCDRRRVLAASLLGLDAVAGIALTDDLDPATDRGALVVKARRAEELFRRLPAAIVAAGANVERVQATDATVEALFGYLIRGAGFAAEEGGEA